ncbi:MAG: hypothetical protein LBB72_01710 [Spirochaetaceae bacterium]|jgi:hypothetical protein|nr:hypothetical protein [Spirochaetaceae bacterium]
MLGLFWRSVHRAVLICCTAVVSLFLISCIGVASRITINQDGSGTVQIEYRIAQGLETIGMLDGNEKWLPVPAGRADLERTAARVQGLSLVSYSSRQAGKDMIHSAEFSFASEDALSAFFDSTGRQFLADFRGKRITLSFPEQEGSDPEFQGLLTDALEGYAFSFSLTVPGKAQIMWLDKEGKAMQNYRGNCVVGNNTVEYTVPMAQLVFLDASQKMEVRW